MIRLGLVGCGAWGWRYIPAAREAGNCEVVRVSGVRSCPESALPELTGIAVDERWEDLLDRVDAVVIATHPGIRPHIACEVLRSGKPVMLEKPMALAVVEAEEIVTAAEKAGAPLLVDHQHLFAPAYEVLRETAMGWDKFDAVAYGAGKGPVRDYSALWDYGPHDVAMALGLCPELALKSAVSFSRATHVLVMENDDGKRKFIANVSCDSPVKLRSLTVLREGETLCYDDFDLGGAKLRHNGGAVELAAAKPLTRAVRAFAEACASGTGDWRFGRFGLDVVRVLEEAQKKEATTP